MAKPDYDALVIGAGAAGLAASVELARAGQSALLLEARDRIGGRCHTLEVPGLAVPVELGAEFIHGWPIATLALLERAGTAAVDAPRKPWLLENGRLTARGDFFAEIQEAMRASHALAQRDLTFDAFLDRALRGTLSEEARAYARMLVQGYDAADPARASARAIVEEWSNAASGNALARPLRGYGPLLALLHGMLAGSSVATKLQTVVRAVEWKRGAVRIDALSGGRVLRATAARAIITLPVGVLQCRRDMPGAVRFTPALGGKLPALRRLGAGPVTKVALHFRRAFWETLERGRYRDATFFHAPDAPFPTLWTALPVRAPLLVAWAGGPIAARMTRLTLPHLVQRALQSVRHVFGEQLDPGPELVNAYVHDWQRDPHARGAYSYVLVGGAKARAVLAASLARTLYFAGEATDVEGEAGTVAGALQSGTRAARELLSALMGPRAPLRPAADLSAGCIAARRFRR